eukprot:Rhum_TRINITY_DN14025_c5_g1::Rhum_TRINITY_DN14025_c5_g1_i1::g.67900::m.67900
MQPCSPLLDQTRLHYSLPYPPYPHTPRAGAGGGDHASSAAATRVPEQTLSGGHGPSRPAAHPLSVGSSTSTSSQPSAAPPAAGPLRPPPTGKRKLRRKGRAGKAEESYDDFSQFRKAAGAATGTPSTRKAFCHYKNDAPAAAASGYEGLDYWEPFNVERRRHIMEHHAKGSRLVKWCLFALVGAIIAVISVVMKQTVERVVIFRFKVVHQLLGSRTSDDLHAAVNHSAVATPAPTFHAHAATDDISAGEYSGALFFWVTTSMLFVAASVLLVLFVEPKAAGSGLPEVMAYLNGVQLNRVFTARVMAVKFLSCFFAVSSGLPVGPEGPMIHLGSMVGAFLTQKRWERWPRIDAALSYYRNTMDRRAFMTCGAAAGVSAAFGAPVGGLLFVMEEIASYWDRGHTWMIFFSTMVAFFIVVIWNSVVHGWAPTGYTFGSLVEEAVVLFQPEIVLTKVNLNLFIIFPSAFVGLLCGLAAVLFTRVNLAVVKWRRRVVMKTRTRRILEPLVLALLYACISFAFPLISKCQNLPPKTTFNGEEVEINQNDFAQFTCTRDHEYSPLATLTLNSGENAVRHLFSKGTRGQFHSGALLAFLILYFFSSAIAAGAAYSTGIVIPMLVIGSAIGRLTGEFFHDVIPMFNNYDWFDPGLFALIGSSAFFAGVSRLTVSLAVIMMEISHEIYFLPPMMVAIMIAKWTADYKEPHSLYHALIHLMDVPFLDSGVEAAMNYELFTAEDVMASPVVSLREKEYIGNVYAALSGPHTGFPVVDKRNRLKGFVLRVQLETILARISPEAISAYMQHREQDEKDRELSRSLERKAKENRLKGVRETLTHDVSWSGSGGGTTVEVPDKEHILKDVRLLQTDEAMDAASARRTRATIVRRQDVLSDAQKKCKVDLTEIMSTSPFTVHKGFRLNLTRISFQAMSMRHLVVVDSGHRVTGVITRKDLIKMDQDIAAFRALYEDGSDVSSSDGGLSESARSLQPSPSSGQLRPPKDPLSFSSTALLSVRIDPHATVATSTATKSVETDTESESESE